MLRHRARARTRLGVTLPLKSDLRPPSCSSNPTLPAATVAAEGEFVSHSSRLSVFRPSVQEKRVLSHLPRRWSQRCYEGRTGLIAKRKRTCAQERAAQRQVAPLPADWQK